MSWLSDIADWGGKAFDWAGDVFKWGSKLLGGENNPLADLLSGPLGKALGIGLDYKHLRDTRDAIEDLSQAKLAELDVYKKATALQQERTREDLATERRQTMGTLVSRLAASGVRVDKGTPASLQFATHIQFQKDLGRIEEDYKITKEGFKVRENIIRKSSSHEKSAATMNFYGASVRSLFG